MVQEDSNPETGIAIVEQRNKFSVGDTIEVMPAKGNAFTMKVSKMWDEKGNAVESAPHPQQILQILFEKPVKKFDMLRKNVLDAK
ncbi:hypothetical protein SDC9_201454 [bioreactor metagenome]|uniref:Peptidase family U32 C-terminal domain-containing protein n=2 Tax=root TaxID=1 RepID=A0A645IQZ2_9ZZZZ